MLRMNIHIRNYALATASASFPSESRKDPMDISLGSKVWSPKMTVLDPKRLGLNKSSNLS